MDLIRKIALAIEAMPSGFAAEGVTVDGYTDEQVGYHSYLMLEHGLARGANVTYMGSTSPAARLTGLTWEGHEFAEAARDEKRWKKATSIVQDKAGSVTFSILTELLKALMKTQLGLP